MTAADLIRRGYRIAIPYGEDWDLDLIFCRDQRLERATSDGASRIRTGGLSDANRTLYQLSYGPLFSFLMVRGRR